ncbi:hypothetical protein BLOT_001046 [Blomia tropicalis]|nr:hypothetical protein BLOT_001046 [Blomia tropicalis]
MFQCESVILWNHWNRDLGIDPIELTLPIAQSLWNDVQPFYTLLMDYIRSKLSSIENELNVNQLIEPYMFRSISVGQYDQIIEHVLPYNPISSARYDSLIEMMIDVERIYHRMGFDSLPSNYWKRSKFITELNQSYHSCHPLSFDLFSPLPLVVDVRTRMCVHHFDQSTKRQLIHELGHVYYFRSYSNESNQLKLSANTAIHESIGDAIYLMDQACMVNEPMDSNDPQLINRLMLEALTTFVRIPYGLSLELWRFQLFTSFHHCFNSTIERKQLYWQIRKSIQQITVDKDHYYYPLSKFHVSNFMPYLRYVFGTFFTHQIHENLCSKKSGIILANCCPNKNGFDRLKIFMSNSLNGNLNSLFFENNYNIPYRSEPLLKYYQPLIDWLQRWRMDN